MKFINSTIIEHYDILTKYDVGKFEIYLKNNYKTKGNYIYNTHEIIYLYYKNHILLNLNYETIFNHINLDAKEYKKSIQVRVYINKLQNIIKEYIILLKTKNRDTFVEILWGSILLKNQAKKSLKIKRSQFKNNFYNEENAFLRYYFHNKEALYLNKLSKNEYKYHDIIDDNRRSISSLDEFYTYSKIEIYLSLFSSVNKFRIKFDEEEKFNILDTYGNINDIDRPMLSLFSKQLALTIDPSVNNYEKLKSNFYKIVDNLSPYFTYNFSSIIINYCIQKMNDNVISFRLELYNFYQYLYEKNILLSTYFSSHDRLVSYISLELAHGSIEKAQEIFDSSIGYLKPHEVETSFAINQGRIYMYQEKYDIAMKLFKSTDSKAMPEYQKAIKALAIQCHAMSDDNLSLEIERKQMIISLKRNKKMSHTSKEKYTIFLKTIQYMSITNYKNISYYRFNKLKETVNTNKDYILKYWIQTRFDYLQERYPRVVGRKPNK